MTTGRCSVSWLPPICLRYARNIEKLILSLFTSNDHQCSSSHRTSLQPITPRSTHPFTYNVLSVALHFFRRRRWAHQPGSDLGLARRVRHPRAPRGRSQGPHPRSSVSCTSFPSVRLPPDPIRPLKSTGQPLTLMFPWDSNLRSAVPPPSSSRPPARPSPRSTTGPLPRSPRLSRASTSSSPLSRDPVLQLKLLLPRPQSLLACSSLSRRQYLPSCSARRRFFFRTELTLFCVLLFLDVVSSGT